jgi:sugar O-acyltransferase (sialic acid O-acetyltransferase NeuD family)
MTGPGPADKLVLVGDSLLAEIALEYFTHDSPYEVVAFAVEQDYLRRESLGGLPVVPFETVQERYDPAEHDAHVAVTYGQLNRLRARLAAEAKAKGFGLASYVSSRAFVWRNVQLGEHCFIFEHNVVQPFVRIGNNVVLWSGNHIGHHSSIGDNCFISSHVVVSGSVEIGENCFLGVNATLVNDITIGRDAWIGPDVTITRDVEAASVFRPPRSELRDKTSLSMFGIDPGAP